MNPPMNPPVNPWTHLEPLRAVLPDEAGRTPGPAPSLRAQPAILRPHTGGGEAGAGAELVVLDPSGAQAQW